jgi:hypothetical protein
MHEPIEVSSEVRRPDGQPPTRPTSPAASSRRRSLFWPIALIAFGGLLLLSNLGVIPATGWAVLWRFWPIALVALGIDVLIGRRSVAGAIASGVLTLVLVGIAIGIAFFAEQVPYLVELARPATLKVEHLEHPLGQIEEAAVTIDWTSAPAHLGTLEDSGNLLEADIAYRGERVFNVATTASRATVTLDTVLQGISYGDLDFGDEQHRWNVLLSPDVILDLVLDASSGSATFDLRGLSVRSLELDASSGATEVLLPTSGRLDGRIDGGSGALTLRVSEGVGLRVRLNGGSGSFDPGDQLGLVLGDEDDGTWETDDFEIADHQVVLTIDQGSGSIRIE